MTRDLSISLLNRAATGDQLLTILDSIVEDVTAENIADCAAHYAAISAPTADPIAGSDTATTAPPSTVTMGMRQ
jgi:hypothetical protein